VVCERAVGGGRGQGSPAAGGLPVGRARVFWAGPLCGIIVVWCLLSMVQVDALTGGHKLAWLQRPLGLGFRV
jgi:hypothetical protein